MDRLTQMRSFVAVVNKGGFTAAGRYLGVPLPTISRHIRQLEAALGTQLLHRSTRHVSPTDVGKRYLSGIQRVLNDLDQVEIEASGEFQQPQGELTIATPVPFGSRFLSPIIADFLSCHPRVRIRHVHSDQHINFVEGGIDLGISIGKRRDSGMRLVALGETRIVTFATRAYLRRNTAPQTPADLEQHRIVAQSLTGQDPVWLFETGRAGSQHFHFKPRYIANSIDAVIEQVSRGAGIGQLYSYQIKDLMLSGKAQILLCKYEPTPRKVSLVYPDADRIPLKVRAFIDFAANQIRRHLADVALTTEASEI